MKILVTGANGFVGQAMCSRLATEGHVLVGTVRTAMPPFVESCFPVGDLGPDTDWKAALMGCEAIVHLAARVHVMHDDLADPLSGFRKVNVEGTRRLAEQAVASGVRRFVFVSSIKVNGEFTFPGHLFSAEDKPEPVDAYGLSKWEAEQILLTIAARSGLEVVIVRPPLVYGPGVKANFARLMGLIWRGVPLPLGSVKNRRSLVGLDNLVDFLLRCIEHPRAVGQTFMVADGNDLSTPELIRQISAAMGLQPRLIPFPVEVLRFGGRLMGRPDQVERLIGSLQVDINHSCITLDWTPPVSFEVGIRRTVGAFKPNILD